MRYAILTCVVLLTACADYTCVEEHTIKEILAKNGTAVVVKTDDDIIRIVRGNNVTVGAKSCFVWKEVK